jgi:hypothetical protein
MTSLAARRQYPRLDCRLRRAKERVSSGTSVFIDLNRFGFSNITGIDPRYSLALLMNFQHDLDGFGLGLLKEALKGAFLK